MDAWETKYADCRGAAIDRLEQLCQEKIHLKVPASTSNLKSKKKSQLVDVSVLKAPTGSGSTPEPLSTSTTQLPQTVDITYAAKTVESPVKTSVKVSKICVTAKPHNVKPSTMPGLLPFLAQLISHTGVESLYLEFILMDFYWSG
jgi:hypothetical protein